MFFCSYNSGVPIKLNIIKSISLAAAILFDIDVAAKQDQSVLDQLTPVTDAMLAQPAGETG